MRNYVYCVYAICRRWAVVVKPLLAVGVAMISVIKYASHARQRYTGSYTITINLICMPLTRSLPCLHAAPSLGKRPIKEPNLKSLSFFPPFARAREKSSIKMHSTDSIFVTGPWNILSAGMYVCTFFSPDILQAAAVKGLMRKRLSVCWTKRIGQSAERWCFYQQLTDV